MNESSMPVEALLGDLISGDDLRAEQAVHHIASRGASVIPRLVEQLSSPDPDRRWWATAALARIEHADARISMTRSLQDPDLSVRQCAALGLRQQPSQEAIPALLEALHDPDKLLARLAGDALIALGTLAVSPLTEALRDDHPAVRIEAARALAHIDDPAVIAPLFAALEDQSAFVIYWAEFGLQRMGVGMVYYDPGPA
jgi:HEAT repeat protein